MLTAVQLSVMPPLPHHRPCQALESCQQHAEALRCGAVTLLSEAGAEAGAGQQGGGEGERLPLLYDARALQLWLLKCCQAVRLRGWRRRRGRPSPLPFLPAPLLWLRACTSSLSVSRALTGVPPHPCLQQPRGGLRDKPGKAADYYHTCYCLRWAVCSF